MNNSMQVIIDLTAGTISGAVGTLVGHPLDTLKVRMQMGEIGTGINSYIVKMMKEEGL